MKHTWAHKYVRTHTITYSKANGRSPSQVKSGGQSPPNAQTQHSFKAWEERGGGGRSSFPKQLEVIEAQQAKKQVNEAGGSSIVYPKKSLNPAADKSSLDSKFFSRTRIYAHTTSFLLLLPPRRLSWPRYETRYFFPRYIGSRTYTFECIYYLSYIPSTRAHTDRYYFFLHAR